jgi:hypothetical protein
MNRSDMIHNLVEYLQNNPQEKKIIELALYAFFEGFNNDELKDILLNNYNFGGF